MLYFYKNYDCFSKFATVLSRIGGVFYASAIIFIITFLCDSDSLDFQELIFGIMFCIAIGFGLNKWAEVIANKKMIEKNDNMNDFKETADNWKCHECGKINSGKFCSECGSSKVIKKYCENCGQQIIGVQKYCGKCGNKI